MKTIDLITGAHPNFMKVTPMLEFLQPLSAQADPLDRMDEGVAILSAEFSWDDLGAWDALARVLPVDDGGNVIVGEVQSMDTTQSVIVSAGLRVATVGLSEEIVVASKDGVLVCPKGRAQEARRIAWKSQ